jgi:thiosulfate/3-mercaptopyruvate sulfurtransferase
MSEIDARGYAHPEVLVSTDWVAQHLDDPSIRLIESNEDTLLYASGHVPGAVHVDWTSDLNDQIRRDYITREGFEQPTATRTTGGRATRSGCSSCSATRTPG